MNPSTKSAQVLKGQNKTNWIHSCLPTPVELQTPFIQADGQLGTSARDKVPRQWDKYPFLVSLATAECVLSETPFTCLAPFH